MKTHECLSGVEAGDIGSKLASNHTDNGYLILTNFRQPQDSLLQRFIKVNDDGSFETSNPLV